MKKIEIMNLHYSQNAVVVKIDDEIVARIFLDKSGELLVEAHGDAVSSLEIESAKEEPQTTAQRWRDRVLRRLDKILGPGRHNYGSGSYSGGNRNEHALRAAADAFGGNFATFYVVLADWLSSIDVTEALQFDSTPHDPSVPPPGIEKDSKP